MTPTSRSGSRLTAFLSQLFGLGASDSIEFEHRARNVQVFSRIGLLVGLLFSVFNILNSEFLALGLTELIAVLFLLAPAIALSQRQSQIPLAENLLMLSGVVIFLALVVFGGIQGTGLFWVYIFPFLAFFIKGQKSGWTWSLGFAGLVLLHIGLLQTYMNLGYRFTPVYVGHFLASLVFYTLVAAAFNLLRSSFEARLHSLVQERTQTANNYLTQLQYLASHDSLTGLPNRDRLLELLQTEIEETTETGMGLLICTVQLNRLFEIGNVLGMSGTDKLIRSIVEHLVNSIAGKGILARTQRDQFLVIYRLASVELSDEALNKFLLAHQISIEEQGIALNIEFTLGLCIYPTHSDLGPVLLQKAEQAMLQARKHNLPWSIYDEEQDRIFVRHHMLFSRLREAVQAQRLKVHYQPQIDLSNGRVIGAEALMRWTDSIEGPIAPDVFIPVAEDTGLIRPMTAWLLRECMRECASWQSQGLAMDVSINLSALSLNDPDLTSTLVNAAQEAQLDPGHVNLELTESSFMESPERALEIIQQIRNLGFRMSIDDFGTGYSSLSYLKNLPISELKIDQGFVRHLLSNPGDQSIVTSTIELAHNFGLTVVAEGIEDQATAQWLQAHHCDRGQGYCFARPMPANELLAYVRTIEMSVTAK